MQSFCSEPVRNRGSNRLFSITINQPGALITPELALKAFSKAPAVGRCDRLHLMLYRD